MEQATTQQTSDWLHFDGQAFRASAITRVFILNGILYAEISTLRESKPYQSKSYYMNHAIAIKDTPTQAAFCKKIGVDYEKLSNIERKAKSTSSQYDQGGHGDVSF